MVTGRAVVPVVARKGVETMETTERFAAALYAAVRGTQDA